MKNVDQFIPLAITAAANALEQVAKGNNVDINDVIAGSMALQSLTQNAVSPTPSLNKLSDTLLDFVRGYPGSMPKTTAERLLVSGHVMRLRNILGFL